MTLSFADPHVRGLALTAAGALMWSPDGLMVRLMDAGDGRIVFWRAAFTLAALLLVLAVRRRSPWAAWRANGWPGVLAAIILAAVGFLFIAALTRTTVANTLVIIATMPLFGAALGWLFLREAVPPRTILAIAVSLVGFAIIFADAWGGGGLVGDALALMVPLLLAGYIVVMRRWPKVENVPALALASLILVIVLAPLVAPFEISGRDLALLALNGTVQGTLATLVFLAGARLLLTAEAGLMGLLETILGPLWVWLALGERPSERAFAGALIVLAALAAHAWTGLRRRAMTRPHARHGRDT